MASQPKRPRHESNLQAPIEKYVEILGESTEYLDKFQYVKSKTCFQITNVPSEPEGLLAEIFQYCINTAIAEARSKGMDPDNIGCNIQSLLLNEGKLNQKILIKLYQLKVTFG